MQMMEKTHVEEFGIIEDLAVLEVVSLGIAEALFEVVLDGKYGGVLSRVQLRLDLVKGDGLLDYSVIVWVHAFVGEAEKID